MSNTWENAIGSVATVDNEMKQKQREIQQKEWDKDFPNLTSGKSEVDRIIEFLANNDLYRSSQSLEINVKELVSKYKHMEKQVQKMKDAFRG